jgi:mRNA interferase MazF
MRRGEVWWVSFGPAVAGQIKRPRPAVIVSNDVSNRYLNRVQVVPLSSCTERVYPSETLVTVAGRQNKAMANQVTTVSKLRLGDRIGRLSSEDVQRVEQAIRVQLGLFETAGIP